MSMFVKAEGPSGRAKIHSDEPKHALGLVHYLRGIGYKAWIEDTDGNEVEETALKKSDSVVERSGGARQTEKLGTAQAQILKRRFKVFP